MQGRVFQGAGITCPKPRVKTEKVSLSDKAEWGESGNHERWGAEAGRVGIRVQLGLQQAGLFFFLIKVSLIYNVVPTSAKGHLVFTLRASHTRPAPTSRGRWSCPCPLFHLLPSGSGSWIYDADCAQLWGGMLPSLPAAPPVNDEDLHFEINLWKVRRDRDEQTAALESSAVCWHRGKRVRLILLKNNEVRSMHGFSFSQGEL